VRNVVIAMVVAVAVVASGASPVSAATAADDSYTVVQGGLLNVVAPGLLANDSVAAGGYIDGYSQPAAGTLDVSNNGWMVYSPGDFVGTVTFTYAVRDDAVTPADEATVTIVVRPAAPPPSVTDPPPPPTTTTTLPPPPPRLPATGVRALIVVDAAVLTLSGLALIGLGAARRRTRRV